MQGNFYVNVCCLNCSINNYTIKARSYQEAIKTEYEIAALLDRDFAEDEFFISIDEEAYYEDSEPIE